MIRSLVVASMVLLVVISSIAGCAPAPSPTTVAPPELSDELIIYYWEDGMPQAILDAFTEEYGVTIDYRPYSTYDEVVEAIDSGDPFDISLLGIDYISRLLDRGDLAEINYAHVPNSINVATSFRDLSFDPGGKFSIPFAWGTTGLVVRSDLFEGDLTTWDALWQGAPGTIGIWDDFRSLFGLTLRSLGYSVNTQNQDEIRAAADKLMNLQDTSLFLEQFDPWTCAYELESGRITIAFGWSYDALLGQELSPAIDYVIPDEGTLLWLESMVIPRHAPHQYTAEVFMNFMLRPEIAGQFVNETYYAVANELIEPYVDPEIWENPLVYPPNEVLMNAEFQLPLTSELQGLYDELWGAFKAAVSQNS